MMGIEFLHISVVAFLLLFIATYAAGVLLYYAGKLFDYIEGKHIDMLFEQENEE